ncbi:AAA family ATPase [Sinorhizobium meliloti]|uniref:ATPase AAA n=1 Tax=Rhizobium meliloti TaxID=382 RepID=UPI00037E53C8|nr:ATPase AAA [Sinorhizobium meliloti]ARS67118.1 AAA family ATPase [Sinorhizobium meliloti RU11/001]MDE3763792.1 AAA family ATPase [Sinorhizobium meliloti]MDE3776150.1 AAA family ATPase [Sinorhizobium meliloti]MDE3787857.1 AAA family ATPase [Sinorhizobium meliloti]MDE3792939.1 AAA family ATPase [Sinorhizobium meliloti]
MQCAPIHLDDLRWEPGNYGIARNNQLVANEVAEAGKADSWLMEGVYGWLANVVLHQATTLIWIDLPEEECIANVKERGIQGGGSVEEFQELLKWIAEYRLRNNSSCFLAHSQLFEAFAGSKFLLKSRTEIGAYLDNVSRNPNFSTETG